MKQITADLIKIEAYLYHKKIAKRQRDSYNFLKNNIKEDELFFDLDWKQKVFFDMKLFIN